MSTRDCHDRRQPRRVAGGCANRRLGCQVKEMEAAAVAWIGSLHDVPVGAGEGHHGPGRPRRSPRPNSSAPIWRRLLIRLQRTTLALLARLGEEIGADA